MMLRWIEELNDSEEPAVGAKMARLGTLRSIGLQVPEGFAVVAEASTHFLTENHLGAKIRGEIDSLRDTEDLAEIDAASGRIRELLESARVSDDLQEALHVAYDELCFRCGDLDVAVAVRSSAIGEDAADASFAGQYETYLGVRGSGAIIESVKKAWSSRFNPRALSYLLESGHQYEKTPMAVGVLRLAQARCAGVAFSAHPVTGDRNRVVIEGSWGWGEAVVQGLVQPDHIEIDKSDDRTLVCEIADKRVVSAYDATEDRIREREMPERFRRAPCLTEDMIVELVRVVRVAETHFGKPIDLEWAVEQGWQPGLPATVLQVRPITALPDPPDDFPPEWDPLRYANKYAFGA